MHSITLALVAAAALVLTACGTVQSSGPTAEGLAAFQAGRAGALVVNFSSDLPCAGYNFSVSGSGANQSFYFSAPSGSRTSEPAIIPLPPGRYALSNVGCATDGALPSAMPGFDAWFGEVEVRPGVTTYFGTVIATRVELLLHTDHPQLDRFLTGDINTRTATYLRYEIVEDPGARASVSEVDAGIAAAMVFQPPEQTLATDDYLARLRDAHLADEAGILPTAAVVHQRLALALTGDASTGGGKPTGPDPTAPYREYRQNIVLPPIVVYLPGR